MLHQRQGRKRGKCAGVGARQYIERLSCNHFYTHQFWGEDIANADFVHYPEERWFKPGKRMRCLPESSTSTVCASTTPMANCVPRTWYDTNSGNVKRGICALPYVRQSDGETVYFPTNLIDNLYLSNGMSAGNTLAGSAGAVPVGNFERRGQREIIEGEIALPDVPADVLAKVSRHRRRHRGTGRQGFPVLVKDASLGGAFPVMCVTLMNPAPPAAYSPPSARIPAWRWRWAQPDRLLQGRSFEGLNDLPQPTFESNAVTEPNNFVEHFIDSSGVVSWRFSARADYDFVDRIFRPR